MPFPQDFGVEEKPQKIQCPPFLTPIVLRRQCSYELNVLVNPAAAEISELFKWVCLQGIPKSIDYSQLCHFPNELRTLSFSDKTKYPIQAKKRLWMMTPFSK